jgi:hypothetical protein
MAGMKYRKLRIAWSVGCGILCLLLIALWVRSYSWAEAFSLPITGKHLLGVGSAQGGMSLIKSEFVPGYYKSSWQFDRDSTTDPSIAKVYRPSNRPGFFGVLDLGVIVSSPFFVICFPYWFLVGVTMAMAAIPWRKRMWQFSLRTLLIGITVAAVGLGLAVWALRGS